MYGIYCTEARGLSAIYAMHPECMCYNYSLYPEGIATYHCLSNTI